MATLIEEQRKFAIYLVGFPETKGNAITIPNTSVIKRLIPEAHIFSRNIWGRSPKNPPTYSLDTNDGSIPDNPRTDDGEAKDCTNEDDSNIVEFENMSKTSSGELSSLKRIYSLPEWIDREATELLNQIRHHSLTRRRKVVLAGYGFGGFIVKRAVIMAHSSLAFHDLVLTVDTLIFIDTPHRPSGELVWEELLLRLLSEANRSYHGGLPVILSGLTGSISQLSSAFYKFAAKYRITNIIEQDAGDEYQSMKFDSTFEEVILRPPNNGTLCSSISDVEYLELLRKAFTPRYVNQDANIQESQLQLSAKFDSYFRVLQRLSPSQWSLYSNCTIEDMDDIEILKKVFNYYLNKACMEKILAGSIEIYSPKNHGGLVLLKLLCRQIIESSSSVLVECNSELQAGSHSKYNMYMSFIHQIISQRPSLFFPIQNLATELLSQSVWTEEALHLLLSSILMHSDGTHFVVAIYDFESWPFELQYCLSKIQDHVSKATGSSLSILTCGRYKMTGLTREKVHEIKLDTYKHVELITSFIHAKLNHLLDQNHRSASIKAKLKTRILQIAIPLAESFNGSFSSIGAYLTQLVQAIPLTSIKEITNTIQGIPATSTTLYTHCLYGLFLKPKSVLSWATKVLSWLLFAVRPLHIKELAIAAALRLDSLTLHNVRNDTSIDVEKDIRDHLGPLVRIQGQFACLDSRELENILLLFDENSSKKLNIMRHHDIARLCLHYLRLTITRAHENEVIWKNCLAQVSHTYQELSYDENDLHFLEYACQFWPLHLHRAKTLDEQMKIEVSRFFESQPDIPNKWFRLYLLCNGQISKAFSNDTECQTTKMQVFESLGTTLDGNDMHLPQTVNEMADYVGLSKFLISYQLESGMNTFREIKLKRGYWSEKIVIRNTKSWDYLDLIIENDDAVKELFIADPERMICQFPLHRAAVSGCLDTTKTLFGLLSNHSSTRNAISSLSQINSDGRTPLHMAALCGSEEILRFLVSKPPFVRSTGTARVGDIIDVKDNYCETALIVAVRMGNMAAADTLLASGATVKIQDSHGRTALHFAASYCSQLIRSLINQDIDAALIVDRDGCTPLHFATKYGSENATIFLLEALRRLDFFSKFISMKDNTGKTALQYAAERGFAGIAQHISRAENITNTEMGDIKKAAELAATNGHLTTLRAMLSEAEIRNFGHQMLNAAACSNQLVVVYYLLQNRVSPDQMLEDGHIILSNVLSKGLTDMVRILLDYGAHAGATDSLRRSPLHHAAANGRHQIAEMLLAHQPSSGQLVLIEAPDSERYTPLHYAARAGDVTMVELLLGKDATVNVASRNKETPLHLAVGHPAVMRLLINAGAELDVLDYYQSSLLHLAVGANSLESVEILLEKGASWDAMDYERKTPLKYAIQGNHAAIVKAILQSPSGPQNCLEVPWEDLALPFKSSGWETIKVLVDQLPGIVDRRDKKGCSLLHLAAEHSEVGVLALLVGAGADVNPLNRDGETPLFQAASSNKADNLQFLIKHGGKVDIRRTDNSMPLHIAAYLGNIESVVVLLEAGGNINAPGINQMTPLFLASQQGIADVIDLLLEKGADPNITSNQGCSPLQVHILSDNAKNPGAEICQLLFSYGANINHQSHGLWAPLHLAVSKSDEYAIKFLLENGADPNLLNQDGLTAFHLSFFFGLANLMLGHPRADGIDLEKKTRSGMAPIHLAVMKSERETVQLMLDKGLDFRTKTAKGVSCLDLAAARETSGVLKVLLNRDWNIEDVVSAYWSAIAHLKSDNVRTLVQKEQSLLNEISEEGLNGLETCLLMRPRTEIEQDIQLAVYFFENEAATSSNRRERSHMSVFELCMFSQARFNAQLLQACLTYLSKSTRTFGLGFRELRAATEVNKDDLDLWHHLKFLRDQVAEEKDKDGWNLHQFLYQAEPRQIYAVWDAEAIKCPTKTPSTLIMPPFWYKPDAGIEPPVNISLDGLVAKFTAEHKHCDIRSIRSDFPFPPRNLGQAYFEVTIHDLEDEIEAEKAKKSHIESQPASKPEPPTVCIGFSGEFSILTNAHTGWNMWSVGYHGDDGKVFDEHMSVVGALTTNQTYGLGHTVGCGIDYDKGVFFFTRNGEIASRHESNVIYRKLYPTISHEKGDCKVTVNFGQRDFLWTGDKSAFSAPIIHLECPL